MEEGEKVYLLNEKIEQSPHYQAIIRIGTPVIRLILKELQTQPDYWFTALYLIVGINPVPPEDQGNLHKMTAHWLAWGVKMGYLG